MSEILLTVGELLDHLKHLDPAVPIHFPGDLSFMRITGDCDTEYRIEVEEPLGYLTPEFVDRNPHVQAAFIRATPLEPGQLVSEPQDVTVE